MKIVYGYHVVDDMICVKEDEASVIALIYDMYLAGNSLRKISDELFRRNIKSPTGNDKWSPQYLDNVLSSKKYIPIVTFEKFLRTCYEKEDRSRK